MPFSWQAWVSLVSVPGPGGGVAGSRFVYNPRPPGHIQNAMRRCCFTQRWSRYSTVLIQQAGIGLLSAPSTEQSQAQGLHEQVSTS
ncbi:Hypothetical protein NTJ_08696 [Nesidiocoris tenuis]|uniref:Secreted protein n=1 Tax=Nesidiocoris tenuis TaxID=355587 RepID=A0ABN7AZJ5_9HEMI|nr:Hypothetical protein NTJ_08696 [Nesidiocoris tenuis]